MPDAPWRWFLPIGMPIRHCPPGQGLLPLTCWQVRLPCSFLHCRWFHATPLKKAFAFSFFFFANAVLFFLRRPVFFLLGCAGDCKAVISLIYVCPWLFPPCGVQGRSPRFKVFWPCRKAQAFRASSAPRPARRDWRFLAKTRCFYAPSFYIG